MKKNVLKYILVSIIILVLLLIISIILLIYSKHSCGDNAYFIYDSQSHTVTVKGTGVVDLTKKPHYFIENMTDRGFGGDRDYEMAGELIFPEETEKIVICEGITGIRNQSGEVGEYLVAGGTYEKLKEIQLPNSIKELHYACFSNQTNLEIINIPESIKKIPDMAFYRCSKLNKIVLPDNVKIIGYSAFEKCNKLYYINFPKSLRMIEGSAFYECATLPEVKLENIRYIAGRAFEKCYNLKRVEINGDIQQLYPYTFDVCLNLKDVKLTDNIKYISYDSFRNCKILNTKSLLINREITRQFHPKHKDETNIEELEKQVMEE